MEEPLKSPDRFLKITVVLLESQIAALDHLRTNIRLRSGISVPRTHIIDGFIAALATRPIAVVEEIILERAAASRDKARRQVAKRRTNARHI